MCLSRIKCLYLVETTKRRFVDEKPFSCAELKKVEYRIDGDGFADDIL